MKEPLVCAIVVTYNGSHLIGRMLRSLQKTEYGNWRLVIVDNGSTDGAGAVAKKEFSAADLLRLEKNRGFANGNNAGMEYALGKYQPDYVVWLNDDMEITDPGWMRVLVETAQRTRAGITGCKLVLPDGRIQYAGGFFHPFKITTHRGLLEHDNGQYDEEKEVDYANGACFLIDKKVIDKIGLVDEGYLPIYFEEADYCARARKAGFKVIYTGKTKLVHYTSTTTKKEASEKRYYIWEKNRIRFVRRNFPILWKIPAYLRILLGIFWVRDQTPGFGISPLKRMLLLKDAFGAK